MEYSAISGLAGDPIADVQDVRASPPSPSGINKSLVRATPVRGSGPNAPSSNRQAVERDRPVGVARVFQAGGINGAPEVIPQEIRASPPNPSGAWAKNVLRDKPVRAASPRNPRSIKAALRSQRPVRPATVFQAGGLSSAPLMVEIENPAGLASRPMNGLSKASNVDTSVSARVRSQKSLRDAGVPVTGDYYDAIRQAAGFSFGPKRMPGQGFAAASYSYPSRQMVIGATLSGTPLVNAVPPRASQLSPRPRFATRSGGEGPRYQMITSPSDDRRKMLSTLMGLGAMDESGRLAVFEEFKKVDPIYRIIESAVDGINKGVLASVTAVGNVAVGCTGGENDSFLCTVIPAKVIAAAKQGQLYALQIDKNKVFAQLPNMIHRRQIDLVRTSLQASLGDSAGAIYDILMDVVNIGDKLGIGEQTKKVREFLTFALPDELRAGWIRFLYRKATGQLPSPSALQKLMEDPALAAAGSYESARDYVKSRAGVIGTPASGSLPGSSTSVSDLIRSGFTKNLKQITAPKAKSAVARRLAEQSKMNQPSASGSDNTMLIVGGVAVLAAVGAGVYFATRK